jgi:hypothetical protein
MGSKIPSAIGDAPRLKAIPSGEQLNFRGRKISIQPIADTLIGAGYTSLDEQAKALGLRRSTTWTIMKTKHKLGHLNNKTVRSILANPDTPVSVRLIIHTMLDRKN